MNDLRFALRQLRKSPGFTIAAVIVLALGIGANTAMFSLVNTLFFAPPAYAKPHEMVQLFSQDKKNPKAFRGFSYPTYLDIREQNTVFSDAMSFNLALIGLGQKDDTRRAFAAIVSSNISPCLVSRGREAAHFYRKRRRPAATRRSRSSVTVTGRSTISIQACSARSYLSTAGRSRSSELRRKVSSARCKFCRRRFGCR